MGELISKRHIFNLVLRFFSISGKFLLVIFISKFLSLRDLGIYGLFSTTLTIILYFLGLDFYTYSTREILTTQSKENKAIFIRDQFIFYTILYIIFLPLVLPIFFLNILPKRYVLLFCSLLVLEHLGQELYRIYIALKMPMFANFLLFLRTGLWSYIIVVLWSFHIKNTYNLYIVLLGWFIGGLLGVLIGICYLNKLYVFSNFEKKVNWQWIKFGIKISFSFFVSTIAFKIIEFSDKYMINYYLGKVDVGIYTFFKGVANLINIIVFTLVVMTNYPFLIEYFQSQEYEKFKLYLKKFSRQIIYITIVVSLLIMVAIFPLLKLINKEVFLYKINVLFFLIIGNIILNISLIPHYVLYAAKKDIIIRNSAIIGAFLNIFLNIFLIRKYDINGAAISTLLSFFIIFIIKFYYMKKIMGDIIL